MNSKNVFCTLFDSNYLTRGLALYHSLNQHHEDFHLFVFAFDHITFEILEYINLEHLTVIELSEFEDEELLAVKSSRSKGEYCWTCTPSVIKYILDNYEVPSCTYLDADLLFFGSASKIFNENLSSDVMITSHNYTKKYDKSHESGIYCVQFMYFKNNENGRSVLEWWRNACIDWCFNRKEDGKFGDQKYLDCWPEKFSNVHVVDNFGAGIAPWNCQQVEIDDDFSVVKTNSNEKVEFIFYHFHACKFLSSDKMDASIYKIPKSVIDTVYQAYSKAILDVEKSLSIELQGKYDINSKFREFHAQSFWEVLKRKVKGTHNIVDMKAKR